MNNKKKIYIITSSFPFGKQEVFLENEVNYLSKFFNITLVPTYYYLNDKEIRRIPNNVDYLLPYISNNFFENLFVLFSGHFLKIRLKEFLKILFSFKFAFYKEFFVSSRNMILFRNSEAFYQIKMNPDFIVYFYWANSSIIVSKYFSNKVYVRVHGGEFNPYYSNGYVAYPNLRAYTKCTFLPISEDAVNKLRKYNECADFVISRLGIRNKFISIKTFSSSLTIVSCSSIIYLKRLDLIIDSLSLVKRQVNWFHFGDGPLLDKFKNYSLDKLNNNVSINWMGRISNSELFQFYENNDVHLFINLSDTEGVPVSVMEAFSFGVPALVRNVGGLAEIVNESNGWILKNPFNAKQVASIIDNYSVNDFIKLSNNAYFTWCSKFNADVNYLNLAQLINDNN